ncbi:MAG: hypothetical protein LUE87_07270 [Lachnospiraceae bacterium]|nr:hypothetical protein [Lachnospiraceae bacterium]
MSDTVAVWQKISGSGALCAIYLVAVIFLFLHKKRKSLRILFVYFPLLALILLLCPAVYEAIANVTGTEVYFRFFWMLPMTATIAYAAGKLYEAVQGKYRLFAGAVILAVIILAGDYIYDNGDVFAAAENEYHIPQAVVDICDEIHREGKEVVAVFPSELLIYVRQYDCTIYMPYGRDVMLMSEIEHPLYDLMEKTGTPSARLICELAAEDGCAYIVISENKEVWGSLEQCGYVYTQTIDGYALYFNEDMLIG